MTRPELPRWKFRLLTRTFRLALLFVGALVHPASAWLAFIAGLMVAVWSWYAANKGLYIHAFVIAYLELPIFGWLTMRYTIIRDWTARDMMPTPERVALMRSHLAKVEAEYEAERAAKAATTNRRTA